MFNPSVRNRVSLAFGMAVAAATPATAQPVSDYCPFLGEARKWSVVAPGAFKAKPFPVKFDGDVYYATSATVGSVCASKGQVSSTWVDGDFVATRPVGGAFKFRPPHPEGDSNIVNHVITGGGIAAGLRDGEYDVIDTTGNNPMIDVCVQAQADMAAGSIALASRAPTHVLGNIVVHPGEIYTMDLRGGGDALVNVDSLVLYPTSSLAERPPYCEGFGDATVASLDIVVDPGAHVVVNVAKALWFGTCSEIHATGIAFATGLLFNALGSGKVTVGKSDYGNFGMAILAPGRKLTAQGFDSYSGVNWSGFWAKNVQLGGGTWIYQECFDTFPDCGDGELSPGFNEWCDTGHDAACPGLCLADCQCGGTMSDGCADAVVVSAFPFAHTQSPNEHNVPGDVGCAAGGIWYTFVAPSNGTVTVRTDGVICDPEIGIFEGSCAALTQLGCGSSDFPPMHFATSADVVGGQTYFVRVKPQELCGRDLSLVFEFRP